MSNEHQKEGDYFKDPLGKAYTTPDGKSSSSSSTEVQIHNSTTGKSEPGHIVHGHAVPKSK